MTGNAFTQWTAGTVYRYVALMSLLLVCGCAASPRQPSPVPAKAAPPLPLWLQDGKNLWEYYPDASKRAHEQGRVVLDLAINTSGVLETPVQIDRDRTEATPRLEEAAEKILANAKLKGDKEHRTSFTVSIVFEMVPCGSVAQDQTSDYKISVCLDPSPWARFDFAAHPPSELEEQIHKILIHGDLADIDFLEATLGMRFWVTEPVPSPYSYGVDHQPQVMVTPVQVPPAFRLAGLSYGSGRDIKGNLESLLFEFAPAECPDISLWAARWKISSRSDSDPHGFGWGTDFQWGDEHGIHVNIGHFSSGGCRMFLSQKQTKEPFASHTDRELIPSAPLVRGIGAVVASGDIRNVALVERSLHVSVKTAGAGQFGFRYEAQTLIPGTDPLSFEYTINDTGLEPSPFGIFSYVPPVAADRTANLQVMVDVYHLCIRPTQLRSELSRRNIHYRRSFNDGETDYVIRRQNEIRIRVQPFGGCVRDVIISQITGALRHGARSR